MPFPLELAFGFGLVLVRVAALFIAAPVLGARTVPARIRLALALAVAFAIFSGAGSPRVPAPVESLALVGLVIRETAFGLAAGFAARIPLDAVHAAGQLISTATGLSYGAVVDPLHGAESTAVTQLLSVAATSAAVALGVHTEALVWLAGSVRALPPGSVLPWTELAEGLIRQVLLGLGLSVRIAYPVMVAATVGHVALGLLSRIAPQLNLSTIGFAITLVLGGGALYLVTPAVVAAAASGALEAFRSGP